jgi:hypothetical protein
MVISNVTRLIDASARYRDRPGSRLSIQLISLRLPGRLDDLCVHLLLFTNRVLEYRRPVFRYLCAMFE